MTFARTRAFALRDQFEAAGAKVVEPPLLQSAELLLDLYGEDIRARAYVTSDALRGEQMLRPDFTVPVVQMHMAGGADPARYTYAGEVFRRQDNDPDRANEFLQVGYEVFDRNDPPAADAEVFALISKALAHLNLRAVTGDIGILMAAVEGLKTSAARKAALRRHIWRPIRFRTLLDRFAGRLPVPESRAALLAGDIATDVPLTGLRSQSEIDARIAALHKDANEPPISAAEIQGLETLLDTKACVPIALQQLTDLSADMPAIAPAVRRFAKRTAAMTARGIDVDALVFEAGHGRSLMEYYDGFVFAFHADNQSELPAIASGGRYDALTRRLGQGCEIPAVGAVVRPGLLVKLEGLQ